MLADFPLILCCFSSDLQDVDRSMFLDLDLAIWDDAIAVSISVTVGPALWVFIIPHHSSKNIL